MMSYFSEDYLRFFSELNQNNTKDWFDQNRIRFEKTVKLPFTAFVEEMIVRVHSDNPDVLIQPGEAIFRIHRDIRFSKDKTPYKTHMSALISPAGRKIKDIPGFYFQIGIDGIRIYAGVHQVEKQRLETIRNHIAKNLNLFNRIINDNSFKTHFGEIRGDKNKRLAPEYQDALTKQPLIANKDFYVFADLDKYLVTRQNLAENLMDYYFSAKPFLAFLSKAFRF